VRGPAGRRDLAVADLAVKEHAVQGPTAKDATVNDLPVPVSVGEARPGAGVAA
jgi:hypothetical protein